MAKLVTKFKYLKPNSEKGAGGYAKYIATGEGVEKIDDSLIGMTTYWRYEQQKKASD